MHPDAQDLEPLRSGHTIGRRGRVKIDDFNDVARRAVLGPGSPLGIRPGLLEAMELVGQTMIFVCPWDAVRPEELTT